MQLQLILILLVALILILLTVQNPNPVSLQFLSWEANQIPLIVVMLISLLAGVILSTLLGIIKQSKLKERISELQREIEDLRYSESGADEEELEE
ncbi:MAG: LapA family protein [Planctomycetota bacterium]|jgi:uncharacterized integral membrane protein